MAENIKLDKSTRDKIALLATSWLQASADDKSGVNAWWEECERVRYAALGDGVATTDGDDPGYEVNHRPLTGPILDTLRAQVCTVVSGRRPFMLLPADDGARDDKTEMIHRAWTKAQFSRVIRKLADIAGDTDLAYYRICQRKPGRIEITAHHPRDVAIFPALPSGFDDATLIGHRAPKPRRQVLAGRRNGQYYADADVNTLVDNVTDSDGTTNVEQARSGAGQSSGTYRQNLDGVVEIWDVLLRLDLTNLDGTDDWTGAKERWYRATLNRSDRVLLALEEYTLSTPWYFTARFIGSVGWYPARSVNRDLLGLQSEYSKLWSLYRFTSVSAAVPRVFGPQPDSQYVVTKPFDVVDVSHGEDYKAVPGVANNREIPILINKIEERAEFIARVSRNAGGGQAPDQTATEAQIIAQNVSVGLEEYIDNFTGDLPRAAELTEEIISQGYDGFAETLNMVDSDPPEEEDPEVAMVRQLMASPIGALLGHLLQGGQIPGSPPAAPAASPDASPGQPPEPPGPMPDPSAYNEVAS